jgi:branched-chain amino acid transport system permease protein
MIALGYTLVYGIIKLINFAHGEFYMAGAYAGFFVLTSSWAAQASPAMLGVWLALGLAVSAGGRRRWRS